MGKDRKETPITATVKDYELEDSMQNHIHLILDSKYATWTFTKLNVFYADQPFWSWQAWPTLQTASLHGSQPVSNGTHQIQRKQSLKDSCAIGIKYETAVSRSSELYIRQACGQSSIVRPVTCSSKISQDPVISNCNARNKEDLPHDESEQLSWLEQLPAVGSYG